MSVWTPDEERAVRWAWFNGVQRKHVCKVLGRSYEALRSYQRRIGLCGPSKTENPAGQTAG